MRCAGASVQIGRAPERARRTPVIRTAPALQIEASLCQVAVCSAFGRRGELLRLVPGWAVLGFGLAREWPLRRAGASGCEPATLDTELFPDCPPGSLSVGVVASHGRRRACGRRERRRYAASEPSAPTCGACRRSGRWLSSFPTEMDGDSALLAVFEHGEELKSRPKGFEVLAQRRDSDVVGML